MVNPGYSASKAGTMSARLLPLLPGASVRYRCAMPDMSLTIAEYFASRDPVAGTVYAVMFGVFAVMPLLVARK
jgi:hypothetical protein